MDAERFRSLLERVATGQLGVSEALEEAAVAPFVDLKHSRLDIHRALRSGFDEVIYAERKDLETVLDLMHAAVKHSGRVLATRIPERYLPALSSAFKDLVVDDVGRIAYIEREPAPRIPGSLGIVTAGSSDRPVAAEASVSARFFGLEVEEIRDVGVAGLPRLLGVLDELRRHDVLVVIAGMEGALPSVIAGLTPAPIIAVPTGIGYGAAFNGITALCSMLSSCSPGLSVVNIDNGFGAALAAAKTIKHLRRAVEPDTTSSAS